MKRIGLSKKHLKKRRTYPAPSEKDVPDHHEKAAPMMVGTNKTSHGSLEFAETEVDLELAPQFKDFVMQEAEDSTGLIFMSVFYTFIFTRNM